MDICFALQRHCRVSYQELHRQQFVILFVVLLPVSTHHKFF